jgi:hypothetical protein
MQLLSVFRALAFALPVSLCSLSAVAQDDTATLQARQRWKEGVAAFDRGDYELARAAFAQVYALKPAPPVLRNLGEAEVAGGHNVAGATHLAQFLREAPELAPAERAKVERSLAKAEALVGRIELTTDVDGAKVFIDNEVVGLTPISHPIYVTPGWREVRLSKDGRDVQRLVETTAGAAYPLQLAFTAPPAEVTEDPQAQDPAPTPTTERDSAATWKLPVVIGGGVLALAGVGMGTYFVLRASSLDDEATGLRNDLRNAPGACQMTSNDCTALDQKVADGRSAEQLAVAGFVAGGVFAVGTALAWWLWPESSPSAATTGSLRWQPLQHAGPSPAWGGALGSTF